MGKLKQKMIEEMDMARECGDLRGDGVMFTCHPTDHLDWSEVSRFIYRLRDYYELDGREIIEVNTYPTSHHMVTLLYPHDPILHSQPEPCHLSLNKRL